MRFFFTTDEVLDTFEVAAADEEWAESVDIPDALHERLLLARAELSAVWAEIHRLYREQHPPPPCLNREPKPRPEMVKPTGPVPTPRTLAAYQQAQEA